MLDFKCLSHRIGIVGTKGSSRDVISVASWSRWSQVTSSWDPAKPTQLPIASPNRLPQGAVLSHMCASKEGVFGALVLPARQARAVLLLYCSYTSLLPSTRPLPDGQPPPSLGGSMYERYPTPFAAPFSDPSRAGVPSVSS